MKRSMSTLSSTKYKMDSSWLTIIMHADETWTCHKPDAFTIANQVVTSPFFI